MIADNNVDNLFAKEFLAIPLIKKTYVCLKKNHITHLLLGTPLVDPSSDAKKHKLTKCCREVKSWRVFFLSHFIYFSGRLRPDMIKAT